MNVTSPYRLVTGPWKTLGKDAGAVRTEVFVREQKIPDDLEWDTWDERSLHCVAYHHGQPVGTGRLLPDGHIGRMAVLPAHRRTGLGSLVLSTLVDAAAVGQFLPAHQESIALFLRVTDQVEHTLILRAVVDRTQPGALF